MSQRKKNAVFQCRKCGVCCEGRGGIVVSPSDLSCLAAFLHIAVGEVAARYCESSGGKLKIRTGQNGRCTFFREGRGCGVHGGKPAICRAWPFFRGNIEDPISLAMAKGFCPGIATDIGHAAFAKAGRAYLLAEGLLAQDPSCEANALLLK